MDVLKVVAMPLVIALLGVIINGSITERQSQESNLRLYADMMARREQADSDLRSWTSSRPPSPIPSPESSWISR